VPENNIRFLLPRPRRGRLLGSAIRAELAGERINASYRLKWTDRKAESRWRAMSALGH